MRALVPLACLCLSACGGAEPDPPPPDPATLAAQRRARGDSAIRARRAELAAGRQQRQRERHEYEEPRRDPQAEERASREFWDKSRKAARRQQQENYDRCMARRDPSDNCAVLHPDAPQRNPFDGAKGSP